MSSPIFFWIFAALMLGFGAAVIFNRNPVACALSLAVSFLGLSGLFFTLDAFFIGIIEILVYAGAVMVLFLFIIMLLDLKAQAARRIRWFGLLGGAAAGLFFAWQFRRVLRADPAGSAAFAALPPAPADEIPALGGLLFGRYVLPFEIVGVLLLVAMLGVVLLSKKELK